MRPFPTRVSDRTYAYVRAVDLAHAQGRFALQMLT